MNYDTIIYNGTIITADSSFSIIKNGTLGIKDGIITSVETGSPENTIQDARHSLDARGGIIMPGLINTHTHLPMTLFRGLADDLPLTTWLNDHIFPAEGANINVDTVKKGTLLAGLEMLLSGTTTCCDGYYYEDAVAEALTEAGMRAVLSHGIIDFPAPGVPDPSKNIETAVSFVERWMEKNPLITPSFFCHTPYTCSLDNLVKTKKEADKRGILFQTHLSETKFEYDQMKKELGISPLKQLENLGILDENTLLVHCVWFDENDLQIIHRTGAKISHNVSSNAKLASGIANIPGMLEHDITVSLGTDGCASNNTLNLFLEMNLAAKIHKATSLDPTVLDAETMVKMATINGAKALGLDGITGSLEKGKAADIIIIDTDKPHLTPLYSAVSHIVYAVTGSDVRDVFVSGKQIVKNRKVQTLDESLVMKDVIDISKRIQVL